MSGIDTVILQRGEKGKADSALSGDGFKTVSILEKHALESFQGMFFLGG